MLGILDVVKLLQLPLDNAAAAARIIGGVGRAFEHCQLPVGAKLNGKQAAQLSKCCTAALQCAGWLMTAQDVNPDIAKDGAFLAAEQCLMFVTQSIEWVEVGYDLLKAVLRPTADGKVPGELIKKAAARWV